MITSDRSVEREPKITSVAIITMFMNIGATYERKNLRWLFRMPRHHAERTRIPTPGHMMRTTVIVSSRIAPLYPGAITMSSHGVSRTPRSTRIAMATASSDATIPATRPAVSSSPSASNRA